MATYNAVLAGYKDEITDAERLMGARVAGAFFFSAERARSGSYSIKLYRGEEYTPIWVGCDAGARTVSVWVWPSANATNCRMKVIDPDTLEVMGEDVNASALDWEKLEVSFTAEKKCYVVILGNYTPGYTPGDRKECYFDDLMVE